MSVRGIISQSTVAGAIAQTVVSGALSVAVVSCELFQTGHTSDAPIFVSAEVGNDAPNVFTMSFDRELDAFPAVRAAKEDFTLTFSGGAVTVTEDVIYHGGEVLISLWLSRGIAAGETGTFSYIPSVGGIYAVGGSDRAGYITNETVINNVE